MPKAEILKSMVNSFLFLTKRQKSKTSTRHTIRHQYDISDIRIKGTKKIHDRWLFYQRVYTSIFSVLSWKKSKNIQSGYEKYTFLYIYIYKECNEQCVQCNGHT